MINESLKKFTDNIAIKIQDLINNDNINPADIMILLSKREPLANYLINSLQELKVLTEGLDRIKLNEYPVVIDFLNLIRFCIDKDYDYALACVLKSPLFRFNEKMLYEVCKIKNNNNITLLNALKEYNKDVYNECLFLNNFGKNTPPYSFFMEVLRRNNNKQKIYENFGESVIDPLDEFFNICLAFERTYSGLIKQFLKWFIEKNIEIKRDLSKSNKVKITTVHGSKGLESKVIILADTTTIPNLIHDKILNFDEDIWFWITKNNIKFVKELKNKTLDKKIEEYYRLLYVALTRAKERLYIYGYSKTENINQKSWYYNLEQILNK